MKINCFSYLLVSLTVGCSQSLAKWHSPSSQIVTVKSDWDLVAYTINDELLREKNGVAPYENYATWNDYWEQRIDFARKHYPDIYENEIVYIHQRRLQLNLPALKK